MVTDSNRCASCSQYERNTHEREDRRAGAFYWKLGTRQNNEAGKKSLSTLQSSSLTEISELESKCWPCTLRGINGCDTEEPRRSRGGGEKQKPYITGICVCVQMCMHIGKCAKLSKFIKSEKILYINSGLIKFNCEWAIRIVEFEKRLGDVS